MTGGTVGQRTGVRALRALGALFALAVVLLGVPWALLAVGNAADLARIDWRTTLFVHADSRLWLALLSLVGWAAWLVLAVTVVLESIAVASRQRIRLALPGTGWLRPAVAALVLAVAAPSVAAAAPTEAPSPVPSAPAPPSSDPPPAPAPSDRPAHTRTYTVAPGDELWSIAERELGAGVRWREIVSLNGLTGSRITPGMVLRLPEMDPPGTIEVELGDTLWSIAEEELDNPRRWPEIGDLNKDVLPDPDVLTEGLRIKLPPEAHSLQREAGPSAPPEGQKETPAAEEPSGIPEPPSQTPPETHETPGEPGETPAPPATPSQTQQSSGPAVPAAEPPEDDKEKTPAPTSVENPASLWVASLGAVLAAGVVTTLLARRRSQLLSRPVGRRVPPLGPDPAPFLAGLAQAAVNAPPRPRHTLLGWTQDDAPVTVDLERARMTVFLGRNALGALGAVVTGLLCGDEPTQVVLPGGHDWADAIDEPHVTSTPDSASGLAALTRMCAERRLALRGASLAQVRSDPDRAEHWQPVVFVFQQLLSPQQTAAVTEAMALGDVGVSAVFAAPVAPPSAAVVHLGDPLAEFEGRRFVAQSLPEPARRALIELLSDTGRLDTEPAPWWRPTLPPNVRPLSRPADHCPEEAPVMTPWPCPPHHPRLLLLGDVEVLGAAGPKPARARLQCLEYCAWLLEHPGATPTAMLQDLLVAETTRRSNMSRLRTWLGRAPDGAQYLPDAYRGRIDLDPRVESDWDRFRALLAGGINLAPSAALAEALSLVRGAPLGPNWFQWAWAEQLRCDMMAMIVDTACELADRAIKASDPDRALWAIAQGRKAGEEFDVLAVREIHALALAGRAEETRSALLRLSRATRGAGRDLAPDLARRVQFALRLVAPPPPAAPPASSLPVHSAPRSGPLPAGARPTPRVG